MPQRTWSESEVRETIESYLTMLNEFHRGEDFTKAEVVRQLQSRLDHRTRPAVEKKFQNISAVLIEMGFDYLDGYVPLFNYQRKVLPRLVQEALDGHRDLIRQWREEVERAPRAKDPTLKPILVEPVPKPAVERQVTPDLRPPVRPPVFANDLALRQIRNTALGRAGEDAVLEYEKRRLHDAGRKDLASQVEHVSVTHGDGLGFDIRSFEESGADRFVEVKTTPWGALTAFYITENELAVSRRWEAQYHLYRLYRFETAPRMFILKGALDARCRLEPTSYRARLQ